MSRRSTWELLDLFKESPEKALEAVFKDAETNWMHRGYSLLWCGYDSALIKDPSTYGSFHLISKKELEGRKYRIGFSNDKPSLHFLDEVYNPQLNKHIRVNHGC